MTLFLHIGMGKTGTTTLQAFLEENHVALRSRGVHVARAPQSRNHRALAMHALDDHIIENSRKAKRLTTPERLSAYRAALEGRVRAEAATLPADGALVFTSEQLTRIARPTEFARLRELLAPYDRPIKIIAYLRRQDKYFLSEYSQLIKGGKDLDLDPRGGTKNRSVYDYDVFLSRWADAFGDTNVIVRPFERSELRDGDIIADFAGILGLDTYADLPRPARQNESLDRYTIQYLRQLNRYIPRFVEGRTNIFRLKLVALLEELSTDARVRLSAADTNMILAKFAEGNGRVARRYLDRQDGILFHEPVESIEAVTPGIDVEKAMEITSVLLMALAQDKAPDDKGSNGA